MDVGSEVCDLVINWETNQGVAVCKDKILWLDFDTLTFWTIMKDASLVSKVAWLRIGKEIVYNERDNIVVFDLQTKKKATHMWRPLVSRSLDSF